MERKWKREGVAVVRFDFSAAAGIIWDSRLSGTFKSKADFVESLFDSYIHADDEQ